MLPLAVTRFTFISIGLVALLYILSGKLGLLLALPPGYATLVWPPSGIAVGVLLVGGRRLWPGIWLGSLLLNCHVSGVSWPFGSLPLEKIAIAGLIATGSTLQALLAHTLLQRWRPLPINIQNLRDIIIFLLLAGPISCLVAASVGVGTLGVFGVVAADQLWSHWLTWWAGDMLGILIFLPIMALLPWCPLLLWRGTRINQFSVLGLLLIMLPVGISLYAWKICAAYEYAQSQARFEEHVRQREQRLVERLQSFEYGLRGAAAYVKGSRNITKAEWHNYVDTLDLRRGFPGALGFGLMLPVAENKRAEFEQQQQRNGEPNFAMHPKTGPPYYIVTYFHPLPDDAPAIGWNAASDPARREAAEQARDQGTSVLSAPTKLLNQARSEISFLLYYPYYTPDKPTSTVKERQQAIAGWTFAPLLLRDVLQSMRTADAEFSSVEIYNEKNPSPLLYRDLPAKSYPSAHTVRHTVNILQQEWSFVWHSTPQFERGSRLNLSLMVLAGGLTFSLLFAVFVFTLNVAKVQISSTGRRRMEIIVPTMLFGLVMAGTAVLYHQLKRDETSHHIADIQGKAAMVVEYLNLQSNTTELALLRMAKRGEVAEAASFKHWQADAAQYIQDLPGLRVLEWVDPEYYIRWAEPLIGNESVLGMYVGYDAKRLAWLREAREKPVSYTSPVQLRQGYSAVIGYYSLRSQQSFLGFLTAIMDLEELFGSISADLPIGGYAITIRHGDKTYLEHVPPEPLGDITYTQPVELFDTEWELQLRPTQRWLDQQESGLPTVVFSAGGFIAVLFALALRSMLRNRSHAHALLARKAQLKLLIKNTPAAVAMFDSNLRYITCSDRWLEDYNLGDAKLIGQHHYDVFPEIRSFPQWLEIHQRALRGEVFPLREDTWWREGSQEWIQWVIHPWRDSDGRVGGIIIFSEVITSRIKAAQALQTSEETLRQSFEHSPIGMALVGLEGQWLRVNDALCDMLGYEREALLSCNFQALTYADDLHADESLLQEVLSGVRRNYQMEKRYIRKNGSIVWAMLHVSLVRDVAGKPHYFVSQVEDIDERKKSEQANQLLIQKLAESNTELERFAYVASHDLREPARLISSYAELLEQEYADTLDTTAQKYIAICSRAAQRMHSLITDLLNYARVGRAAEELQRFAVEESLDYVRDMLTASIAAKEARITNGALPIIQGNKTSFSLLLQNLIANALKYSHRDRTPHIHIGCNEKDEVWEFSVRDNGIGIKPEFYEQIFEPFKRLHSADAYEGTGMGLAICRKIVEQRGGAIWLESIMGEGTVFYFTISKTELSTDSDNP